MVRTPSPGATRRTFDTASAAIGSFLPGTWEFDITGRSDSGGVVRVCAPDGTGGDLTILVRDRFAPRDAATLPKPTGPTIIAAP
jgi:hypothetical protein